MDHGRRSGTIVCRRDQAALWLDRRDLFSQWPQRSHTTQQNGLNISSSLNLWFYIPPEYLTAILMLIGTIYIVVISFVPMGQLYPYNRLVFAPPLILEFSCKTDRWTDGEKTALFVVIPYEISDLSIILKPTIYPTCCRLPWTNVYLIIYPCIHSSSFDWSS